MSRRHPRNERGNDVILVFQDGSFEIAKVGDSLAGKSVVSVILDHRDVPEMAKLSNLAAFWTFMPSRFLWGFDLQETLAIGKMVRENLDIYDKLLQNLPPSVIKPQKDVDAAKMVPKLSAMAKEHPELYAELGRALKEMRMQEQRPPVRLRVLGGVEVHYPRPPVPPVCTCKSLLGQRDPDCPMHRGK